MLYCMIWLSVRVTCIHLLRSQCSGTSHFKVIQHDYIVSHKIANKSVNEKEVTLSELPPPIQRNSVESDHGCTSRIYFDNAGDNVMLTLYKVMLMSQKPCQLIEKYINFIYSA